MSFQIEVGKVSVKVSNTLNEDFFVLFQLAGCNNLIDDETGKFCRSWAIIAHGNKKTILPQIERIAECAEGGSIQPIKGRRSTFKSYLKATKHRLNRSVNINTLHEHTNQALFMNKADLLIKRNFAELNRLTLAPIFGKHLLTEDIDNISYDSSYAAQKEGEPDLIRVGLDLTEKRHGDFLIDIHKEHHPTNNELSLRLVSQRDDQEHRIFDSIKHIDTDFIASLTDA
ncbi:hypothetical protein AB4455_06485 [Vibrio sp. 10N.261.46.E12]|uniref:hypothetical protein n=1 Tax=unclassified Vibrio TaxID=2614977 RepID=UPI0009782FB7|nr:MULTISPECIES: hypothetical protein [unclassified Vibrio]OMO37193.1 hypothetical protein BH584_23795 [Vibrio sp. 10N.261.45.E1]PMJ25774.1 hypothetical protein BCU27_09940 [Vibrio sp. 10N.286.45.B6]PML84431.1 hypothetical protein BCT66_17450 [Vibrio sp. 10N.261.49.E11]PMM90181.1 hypothetical protein BCT46_23735 [Vibrio sp. 10N.261.46.E8]PMN46144.1 hypothetical protein BCT32_11155 [Vibrio sp. 10N.261.45.E11]